MGPAGPAPDSAVAHLLELRLRYRRNPEARALVDRCLLLVGRAAEAPASEAAALTAELEAIRSSLALRFGAPRRTVPH